MKNILINGVKANLGGGKAILNNYLELLSKSNSKDKFYVLTPNKNEYEKYSCEFIEIIDIHSLFKKNIMFIFLYYLVFPILIKRYRIDAIFNFGAVVIPVKTPQLYLFDWAFAIYPESIIWKMLKGKRYLKGRLITLLIRMNIKKVHTVIAQTNIVRSRLKSLYDVSNVAVIPNAVSLEILNKEECFDFELTDNKFKLLYISSYSIHKNMEILIPLAKKIREKALPYQIIITVAPGQNQEARKFIEKIAAEKLESVIENVGFIDLKNVPSLYMQSDALLMPTLLESYGLPYVEAMCHGKIVFTSKFDFAKEVCGEAAYYFDPMDANSILDSIESAVNNEEEMMKKIAEGKNKSKELLTWEQVFEKYQRLLEKMIN